MPVWVRRWNILTRTLVAESAKTPYGHRPYPLNARRWVRRASAHSITRDACKSACSFARDPSQPRPVRRPVRLHGNPRRFSHASLIDHINCWKITTTTYKLCNTHTTRTTQQKVYAFKWNTHKWTKTSLLKLSSYIVSLAHSCTSSWH